MCLARQGMPCAVSAGRRSRAPTRDQEPKVRAQRRIADKEIIMFELHELIRLIRANFIILIVIGYLFFMASFKIWPVW